MGSTITSRSPEEAVVIALVVVVALLAALGWAASRWGADTREPGEWRLPHRPRPRAATGCRG
jgi:hypothetical protein